LTGFLAKQEKDGRLLISDRHPFITENVSSSAASLVDQLSRHDSGRDRKWQRDCEPVFTRMLSRRS
jgi:hypothetical protein